MRYYNTVLPRKWLYIQVIIFRSEILNCCADQGHERKNMQICKYIINSKHEIRNLSYINAITQSFDYRFCRLIIWEKIAVNKCVCLSKFLPETGVSAKWWVAEVFRYPYIDAVANALELRLSCTNPSTLGSSKIIKHCKLYWIYLVVLSQK